MTSSHLRQTSSTGPSEKNRIATVRARAAEAVTDDTLSQRMVA
jgi:hypothetical protein